MKTYNYTELTDELVIDVRDNTNFRAGHLANSLNLTAKQMPKYYPALVESGQTIVAVVNDSSDLDAIDTVVFAGYILFDDIDADALVTTDTIKADDFLTLDTDYVLLDLRHPDEITRPAPKKNLVNISLETLPENLDQLDKDATIYTLCGSGGRATAGAAYLAKNGFTNTHVIEGGIKAVIEAQNK